jgi:plasmid stabilization system protein ParE
MYAVVWLQSALDDLDRQFDFLNEKNPEAASRAVRAILSTSASLADAPERGTLIPNTHQRKLRVFFGKYGYILYYRIESQQVFIVRVHHGRENRTV